MNWRKSTYSRAHQNCVEVAARHALIAARDSQDPDGPAIEVSPEAWTEFTKHIKRAASGHRGHRPPTGRQPGPQNPASAV